MSAIVFLIGFVFVMLPYAAHLASIDPEPLGAQASLLIFGSAGAVLSSVTYWFAGELMRRFPSKFAALVAGTQCSIAFFASLGLIYVGIGFFVSLAVATTSSLLVSFSAPRFTAKR